MRKYVCVICGHACYSAADYDHIKTKACPIVGCRGIVVPEENAPVRCIDCEISGGCLRTNHDYCTCADGRRKGVVAS